MQNTLKTEIKRLCRRAFARHARETRKANEFRTKFTKRTGLPAGLPTSRPTNAPPDRHFDPRYCARNANLLAKVIWQKVLDKTYHPKPALSFRIPKSSGGFREVMAFTIPDAALANVVLRRTSQRNLKRLSPYSFAYHPDRNVFDAILALSNFVTEQRLFAVQIDFERYFDSIPSSYLKDHINDHNLISLTPHERYIIEEFMHHQHANQTEYPQSRFKRRHIGTPQGASVSLLLANLANNNLDRELERRPGRFVRFADDVVVLCSNFAEAEEVEAAFVEHCRASGLRINERKSPGIAIIGKKAGEAELRSYLTFDYLGYRFGKTGLDIPNSVRKRIFHKLSRLIHIYLIRYPTSYGFDSNRCSGGPQPYDWDLLGLILEIRGYLYGGLGEEELRRFTSGQQSGLQKMRGLMGFYTLLDDSKTLKYLDSWLLVQVRLAMRKRANLLMSRYGHRGIEPSAEQLILGTWLDQSAWRGSACPDPRLPSFVRGWRAARKYYFTFGLEDVEPPFYGYY
ncbi:MAG: reverse transcriptase domain-containing protein [Alphaproteobacteria bacterium]|nr:reverse transcriptase domain-containing protein [Alphaproteobacteria bacterium]